MLWVLGGVAVVALAAAFALRWAINEDGPAVLSAVDRITGGARDTHLLEASSYGPSDAQKIYVWGAKYANAGELADAYLAPRPVIVFSHGGGWQNGDPESYGAIARAFVPQGFIVVLAGYRLHPEAVYPAMLEDTANAIGWTHREIERLGGDPDHIILAGHSAGAYNVVMAALEKRWLDGAGVPHASIAGVVGIAGPYDFYPFESDYTKASFKHVDDPEATQPIQHVRADAPPMLLIQGELDITVRPRNARVLSQMLTDNGAQVSTKFYAQMDHIDPLKSLAAPWRGSSDIDQRIADFAARPAAIADPADKPSVSVQDKTR